VTDLAGYRFDQRGQIERRSRGGGLADVAATEKWSDGTDEFGQLRLDDPLHPDELGTGGRLSLGRRAGTWCGVRRRRRGSGRGRNDGRCAVAREQAEQIRRRGEVGGRDAIDHRVREGEASRGDLADAIDRLEPALGAKDQGDDVSLLEPDARRLVVGGRDEHGARAPGRTEAAQLAQELGVGNGSPLGAHAPTGCYWVPRRSTASFTLARSRSMARARLPISS